MKKQKSNARHVATSSKPELKLDWCSYAAAKYAVDKWHYSRCMPCGKMVKVGVWEDNHFVGVVIFSCGASPPMYKWLKTHFGISPCEACEMTRVALNNHATPTSRIIAIALKKLRQTCPGLKMVVSFSDCDQDHYGVIYQAGNWVFVGTSNRNGRQGYLIYGKKTHCRSVGAKSGENSLQGARRLDINAEEIRTLGKQKYLMPLDAAMRKQIEPLRQPYPKRCVTSDTGDTHPIHG